MANKANSIPNGNNQVAEIKAAQQVALLDDDIAEDLKTARSIDTLGRDAFQLPRLLLLQPLSPQVQKKMDGYVEGARAGMIYNSVSGQLYEAPVTVIPSHTDIVWVEWVPKDNGGGFVGEYAPGHPRILEARRDDKGKLTFSNGNVLEETHQQYVVLKEPDGSMTPVLISMKNTQRKESKRWNTQMQMATVPYQGQLHPARHWHYAYQLGVAEAANEKGSWFKWVIGPRHRTSHDEVSAGRAFAKQVMGGEIKVDLSADVDEEHTPAPAQVYTQRAPAAGSAGIHDLDDNDLTFHDA